MGGAAVRRAAASHQEGPPQVLSLPPIHSRPLGWGVCVCVLEGMVQNCPQWCVHTPEMCSSVNTCPQPAVVRGQSVCLGMIMWHGPLWLLQQITIINPCLHSSKRPADLWCMDRGLLSLLSSTSDSAQSLSPARWHLSGNGGFPARLSA